MKEFPGQVPTPQIHLPLPPFGRAWLSLLGTPKDRGQAPRIALGSKAWEMAHGAISAPIMVCPDDADPVNYLWPVRGQCCFLIDTGGTDIARLERAAWALLRDGAHFVLPIVVLSPGELPRVLPAYASDDYAHTG